MSYLTEYLVFVCMMSGYVTELLIAQTAVMRLTVTVHIYQSVSVINNNLLSNNTTVIDNDAYCHSSCVCVFTIMCRRLQYTQYKTGIGALKPVSVKLNKV